jgi:3-methyladenine DNA glycosylase AlkD
LRAARPRSNRVKLTLALDPEQFSPEGRFINRRGTLMKYDRVEFIRAELRKSADPAKAKGLQWFFKTGPGEYGEGDRFLGIRVPDLRRVAKKHKDLSLDEICELLSSELHEERLLALFLLVHKYDKGDETTRSQIYRLYLKSTRHINNWDLVDSSAPRIVGRHLFDRARKPLFRLAKSESLWERRIAVLSTFDFVRQGDFQDAFAIADLLLNDCEDLIHKAVGWMIREVANRDMEAAESFLKPRYHEMPRTMLRYAIEKFPETKRHRYLLGKV